MRLSIRACGVELFFIIAICTIVIDGLCDLLLNDIGLDVFGSTFGCCRLGRAAAIDTLFDFLVFSAERLGAALCASDDPAYEEGCATGEQEEEDRDDPASSIILRILSRISFLLLLLRSEVGLVFLNDSKSILVVIDT